MLVPSWLHCVCRGLAGCALLVSLTCDVDDKVLQSGGMAPGLCVGTRLSWLLQKWHKPQHAAGNASGVLTSSMVSHGPLPRLVQHACRLWLVTATGVLGGMRASQL
jgi:hypothetical protein